jgi:hypothetical protein
MMDEIKSNKVTVEDNSYYVSSSLLDELDYVVGGHGPATVEFLFNFNAFIERSFRSFLS